MQSLLFLMQIYYNSVVIYYSVNPLEFGFP